MQCCSLKLSFCSLWLAAFWNILVLQGFLGWPLKAEKPYVTGIEAKCNTVQFSLIMSKEILSPPAFLARPP
jgi:hypothetical protein